MKKIAALLLAAAMLGSMVGCNQNNGGSPAQNQANPGQTSISGGQASDIDRINVLESQRRYKELVRRANEFITESGAYVVDSTTKFQLPVEGVQVIGTLGITEVVDGLKGKTLDYYCRQTEAQYIRNGAEKATVKKLSSIEGFENGKMFFRDESEKLCGPASKSEYYDRWKSNGGDLCQALEFGNAAEKVKINYVIGIGWQAELSGFDAAVLEEVSHYLGGDDVTAESPAQDMRMKVFINEAFQPVDITMELIFDSQADVAFSRTQNMHSWADVSDVERADLTGYVQLADLQTLQLLNNSLTEATQALRGSFSTETIFKATGEHLEDAFIWENNDVSFIDQNDSYSYTIGLEADHGKMDISYQGGKKTRTITEGDELGNVETAKSTDAKERGFIRGLMNQGGFDPLGVSNAELLEDGKTYRLTFDQPDISYLRSQVKGVEYKVTGSDVFCDMTLNGDHLERLVYDLTMQAQLEDESTMEVHMKFTTEFNEMTYANRFLD